MNTLYLQEVHKRKPNDELLLEDMIDRLDSLREGIEPIEIESIEYGQG